MAKHKVVMNGVEYEVDIVAEDPYKAQSVNANRNYVAYVKHSSSRPGTSFIAYYTANKYLSREDGPAIIYSDGYEGYYLGKDELTKREWLAQTSKLGKVLYGRV